MAEEVKIEAKEKNEKCCNRKKCICKFFGTILASFIGALLALYTFMALNKPPMPPMGHHFNHQRPHANQMMDKHKPAYHIQNKGDKQIPPEARKAFKNNRPGGPVPPMQPMPPRK